MLTPAKGLTYDAVPHAHMVTTAEQVARAVLQNSPYARCFACLATQVGVSEKDARDAAQVLIVRQDFGISRRVCYTCTRVDDVLIAAKSA